MLTITTATEFDFPIIRKIAYETWPVTYGNILRNWKIDPEKGKKKKKELEKTIFQEIEELEEKTEKDAN